MFKKLQQFLSSLNDDTPINESHSLDTCCAVLLCEVMRADDLLAEPEQKHIADILMQEFSLSHEEVEEVIEQAIYLSENATDFYQFTSTINQHYSTKQRVKMVEQLWQLAFIDGELSSIEEHIIRKIADLLHLRQSEFIQAKSSASQRQNENNKT